MKFLKYFKKNPKKEIVPEKEYYRIDKLCKKYYIKNYKINSDYSVDVDDDVAFFKCDLNKIPIKFNRVTGFFNCYHNNLTTLENCPVRVGRSFFFINNKVTTFLGGPKSVRGDINCDNNDLKDVYGFPELTGNHYHHLSFGKNPVCELLYLVSEDKRVKFIYWLNEYNVIRNQNAVVERRLEEAFCEIDWKIPDYYGFKNYKLI